MKNFTKDVVESRGVLYTRMESAGWVVKRGSVHVVPKGYRTILGDDYFQQFGLKLTQTTRFGGKQILQIDGDPSTIVDPIKQEIAKEFPGLCNRIGKSKSHVVRSKFHRK